MTDKRRKILESLDSLSEGLDQLDQINKRQMTFDECYGELSEFLSHKGIGSDKVEGDPVFELAKTYHFHEKETWRLDNE
tara:strand:- start:147 stop:383 length:237 start_codon:yes stop_codon:yes gene_type:complete